MGEPIKGAETTPTPTPDKQAAPKEPSPKARRRPSTPRTTTGKQPPEWYWLVAFIVFLLLAVSLAVALPRQTPTQQYYFRILIGLAAAGIATIISGFIDIELKWLTVQRGFR